ncbi:hypothetical protein MTO98_26750 [Mucilaginibacter sp. SMC90]|uniref:hypothetical protein n=1 Tax=Mucilaginibacter sp. SMC90 TaxID=2929803 RepID=UPI001FB20B42|nr:hypothetical protein [Mucilaginibacter sp. SMC90]UOE48015.1 hypothetical protein MTO98_26750 [Mucilaginibacter sp. SMC90]
MIKIYQKLRNQFEGRRKKAYSISLNEAEAVAYCTYWIYVQLPDSYELNFIRSHMVQIEHHMSEYNYHPLPTIKLLNQ